MLTVLRQLKSVHIPQKTRVQGWSVEVPHGQCETVYGGSCAVLALKSSPSSLQSGFGHNRLLPVSKYEKNQGGEIHDGRSSETKSAYLKPAIDNSWDSREHVSWLSCEKKLFVKYFFARKFVWFRNFTASSAKRFEMRDKKSVSWSDHSNVKKSSIHVSFLACF